MEKKKASSINDAAKTRPLLIKKEWKYNIP